MVLDYYAYWNGGQIRDLFEALVAICSGPSYTGLIKSAVLAGFLAAITGALLKWQGLAAKVYLFAAVLFYSVMLVPKVDLAIHDERSTDVYVVNSVPLGVGFFSSAASRIGRFLTGSFETAFSLPDAERFSRFGLVYPQRAVTALLNAGAVTPEGRALSERVTADCVGPELTDHPDKVNELAQSGNLWATIKQEGWVNPARSTVAPDGSVQSCEAAVQSLEDHLNNVEIDFIKKRLGVLLVPEQPDPSAVIARTLPHSEALLLGVSRSLEDSLKHSVMLSALPRGLESIARQAGAPLDLAVKFSSASATLSSEINYRTLAKLAEQSLPKIRNCVEFIVIAAFPLMLVLMIAAGSAAGVVFRSFFVLLIWVQLWAPLFAVANYLMITVDANPMNRLIAEFGGSTLQAADLIREAGSSSQAIAGSLTLLIPMIAFALAKGSDMAFVSMASGLMAPAQGAASSAANQAGSGNFNAGNVSLGNTSRNSESANKSDLSAGWSDPYASRTQTAYGTVTRDQDGTVVGMQRTAIDLGVSSSGSLTQSRSVQSASTSSVSLTQSESNALSVSSAATSSDSSLRSFAHSLSEGLAKHSALSDVSAGGVSSSLSQSVAEGTSASRSLSNSEAFSVTSGMQMKAAVGETGAEGEVSKPAAEGTLLNAPSSVPQLYAVDKTAAGASNTSSTGKSGSFSATLRGAADGFGVGLSGETKTAQQLVDTAVGSKTSATARQRAEAYHSLRSASEEIAATSDDVGVRQAASAFTKALDKAYRTSSDRGVTLSRGQSASQTVSEGLSGDDSMSVNRDAAVMRRYISSSGHSAEEGLRHLFHDELARENLGASVSADALDKSASGQYAGTGQIQQKRDAPSELAVIGKKTLKRAELDHSKTINQEEQKIHTESDLSFTRLNRSREEFLRQYDKDRSQRDLAAAASMEATDLKKEAVEDSAQQYQQNEKGVSTVLKNAFLGGASYTSPMDTGKTEKENDLSEKK
ncbi:conjugal transfer protein TraG N-terminal domain-containing protein [uncultured Parasutterella sp.]|uniref:conjugal transfer protein TraG N-terminal domain-containing protein n=1 Tax=uncultured Parasutterella sp. TaxID=1263098 RepID=UPI0025B70FC3|nr:conjugal transfer protein TraG N-terminal domain-containing protein [uncultured Parasutterella sp.]